MPPEKQAPDHWQNVYMGLSKVQQVCDLQKKRIVLLYRCFRCLADTTRWTEPPYLSARARGIGRGLVAQFADWLPRMSSLGKLRVGRPPRNARGSIDCSRQATSFGTKVIEG